MKFLRLYKASSPNDARPRLSANLTEPSTFRRMRYVLASLSFYCFVVFTLLLLVNDRLDSVYQNYIGKKIIRIDFLGNQFTSSSDLLALIYARTGLILSKDIINEDIKKIYANGAFSDVKLVAENYKQGVKITFIVKERSYIKEIQFKGLDELIEKDVKEAILLEEDSIYDEKLAAESIEILRLKYEENGFFGANIKIKIEPFEDGTGLKLVFLIDEGEEIKITKINIIGAVILEPEDIINSMELEEDGFIDDGKFQKSVFEEDKSKIITYMRSQGYLEAELLEASWHIVWVDKDKNQRGIELLFKIKEGDQYFFNGYDIEWDKKKLNQEIKKPLYQESQFYNLFEYSDSDLGDVYNDSKVTNDRNLINQLYSREGYIFTRVQPVQSTILLNEKELQKWRNSPVQKKHAKKGIDYYQLATLENILKNNPKARGRKYIHTKFVIYEGDKGYIESIIIKGNQKTQEKVIRREILVKEGQLFNAFLVQRSREQIFNLGFFKDVSLDIRPGSSERKLNLVIGVKEQPTGTISLGGGYGTQAGFTIFTELAEKNLSGTGQRISGKIDLGPDQTLLSSSWVEPWLFDQPWSLSLSLSYSNTKRQAPSINTGIIQNSPASYNSQNFGFGIQVSHRFAIFWGHFHTWLPSVYRAITPSNLAADSIYGLVSQGWLFSNKIINGLFYDSRDNVMSTTSGTRAEFRWLTSGSILGGNDHFMKYEPSYRFYWWPVDFTFFGLFRKSFLRSWRIVFEHRISAGFTQITGPVYNKQLRLENPYIRDIDLYSIGRYESLRGWILTDSGYEPSWRSGGSHRILFGTELRIPIHPAFVWFAFFFEGGALFQDVNNILLDLQLNTNTTQNSYINSIRNSGLVASNFRPEYFRYSWGFGFRIQIPVLPLRFFLTKKVIWDPNFGFFREIPNQSFGFEIGIADQRF